MVPAGVADEDNAAVWYRRAADRLPPLRDARQDGFLRQAWRAVRRDGERARALVRRSKPALGLLRRGTAREACVWDVAYEKNGPPRGQLQGVAHMVRLLLVQAGVQRARGARQAAAESLISALAVCEHLRTDPAMVTYNTRRQLERSVLEAHEQLFARGGAASWRLARLTAPHRARRDFCRALRMHGAEWLMSRTRRRARRPFVFRWALDAIQGREGARFLRSLRSLVDYFARPYPDRPEAGAIPAPPAWAVFLRVLRANRDRVSREIARDAARRTLARVAVRLRRHKARHDRYPPRLMALPGPTPRDPRTGTSLGYERQEEGFRLAAGAMGWRWVR
jgi:hypothetical protein